MFVITTFATNAKQVDAAHPKAPYGLENITEPMIPIVEHINIEREVYFTLFSAKTQSFPTDCVSETMLDAISNSTM